MLEQEEQRMITKINDTRRKADQIMKVKQLNEENLVRKLRFQKALDEKLIDFRAKNVQMKSDRKQNFLANAQMTLDFKK